MRWEKAVVIGNEKYFLLAAEHLSDERAILTCVEAWGGRQ